MAKIKNGEHSRAVQVFDGLLGVTARLEVDKGKVGRVAGHPHLVHVAVLCHRVAQVPFGYRTV